MKKEFEAYLRDLNAEKAVIEVVDDILDRISPIIPDSDFSIFINTERDESNNRQINDLFLFSINSQVKIPDFLQNAYDGPILINSLKNNVKGLEISTMDYDFKAPGLRSELKIHYCLAPKQDFNFKAIRENCSYLQIVVKSYLIPNLLG